jgi:GT2 family glycosyltransferase
MSYGREKRSVKVSVASVTVVYNAAPVLPVHLEALLRQKRPLQEIVVVDNASTDSVGMLLAERYPQVTVLRMSENVGVGGGFATGLHYAGLKKRHDWIWMFDQDSVPNDDALEVLLEGVDSLGTSAGELGIVAALPIHKETGAWYTPMLWRDGYLQLSAEALRQPIFFADLVISSGCMVRRDVVEKIGLPRADFFMYFLDFEYCLRARSYGYKIAVVAGSKFAHEMGNPRKVRLPGFSALWPCRTPLSEYYISRNMVFTAWWLYPNRRTKQFVVGHLIRHAGGALLFGSNKLACLRKIAQGFRDGRRATLGIRFRPNDTGRD